MPGWKIGKYYSTTAKSQTIKAKNLIKTYGAKAFSIGAKANGGGKLTYSIADKKIATVSKSGKVTIKGYGQTKITIKAAAKGDYKSAKKAITLTVKPKKDTKATGYVIQYSTDKNFKKSVKTVTISKNKTTSKNIGKLKAGKKYYVRICAYKKSAGKQIKGSYSAVKTVKIKK